MHNLNHQQIIVIGVAFLFGIPAAVGIVVGHFTGLGGGIFSGVLTMVVIALIAQRWNNKKGGDDGNDKAM